MNNILDKTLFLITCPGDKHEDHIPEWIMPLYKIKSRVSVFAYERLLEALLSEQHKNFVPGRLPKNSRYNLWEMDIGFVQDEDRSKYPKEINEIIDRYLLTENITEAEWEILFEDEYILSRQFFPLKFDKENICKIDYL